MFGFTETKLLHVFYVLTVTPNTRWGDMHKLNSIRLKNNLKKFGDQAKYRSQGRLVLEYICTSNRDFSSKFGAEI